ncbi:Y4rM (plasmid) [Mycetohabitans rhizoxinica HKI 454]|uniref:Y4rM n=1 Tax=Mycetohabitans rhizoxinica (strain DSM 19002 / CIP 109453 / HKI 454) TaxID=882378 RepID=E5AVW4_MYCRK|nr:Y4rM [Mycetohabitans rhizoxinica HKI 454]
MRAALVPLWEPGDRICGKRLKALIPTLVEAMTWHAHLSLSKQMHQRLKQISAATLDRLLRNVRAQAFSGLCRRAGAVGNAIRCGVPIKAFTDWNNPLPGYLEIACGECGERCSSTLRGGALTVVVVATTLAYPVRHNPIRYGATTLYTTN